MAKKTHKKSRSKRAKQPARTVAANPVEAAVEPAAAPRPASNRTPKQAAKASELNRIILIVAVLLLATGLLGWIADRASRNNADLPAASPGAEIPLQINDSAELPGSQAQPTTLQPQQNSTGSGQLQQTQNLQDAGSLQSPQQVQELNL